LRRGGVTHDVADLTACTFVEAGALHRRHAAEVGSHLIGMGAT
jgi:hypothetical protein